LAVLLARVAEGPGPGQAPGGVVRGGLAADLGGVPRARPPVLRAAAPSAPAVGDRAAYGGGPGEGPGPVRQARPVVARLPPPRRPPYEQHARPPDAGDEPVLRPRPTPARRARAVPVALPRVGVVVELHAVAPGDGAGERGLGLPRRTTQPTPVPRLVVAESV